MGFGGVVFAGHWPLLPFRSFFWQATDARHAARNGSASFAQQFSLWRLPIVLTGPAVAGRRFRGLGESKDRDFPEGLIGDNPDARSEAVPRFSASDRLSLSTLGRVRAVGGYDQPQ